MTDDEDTGEPEERKLPNIPWSAWEGQRGIPYFGTKGDDPFSEESQGQRLPKPIPEDFGIRIEPSTPRKEEYLRTLRVCADFPRTKSRFLWLSSLQEVYDNSFVLEEMWDNLNLWMSSGNAGGGEFGDFISLLDSSGRAGILDRFREKQGENSLESLEYVLGLGDRLEVAESLDCFLEGLEPNMRERLTFHPESTGKMGLDSYVPAVEGLGGSPVEARSNAYKVLLDLSEPMNVFTAAADFNSLRGLLYGPPEEDPFANDTSLTLSSGKLTAAGLEIYSLRRDLEKQGMIKRDRNTHKCPWELPMLKGFCRLAFERAQAKEQ